MSRFKNLPSFSFAFKKRGRLWLWFPECREPVGASFPFKEIQGVKICPEGEGWRLEIHLKGHRVETVACFDRKESALEALTLVLQRLVKRIRQGIISRSLTLLAVLVAGLVLLGWMFSAPEAGTMSSSPTPESVVLPPQKMYGIPRDAGEFLREKNP